MIADAETFADACLAAEVMYRYDKKSKEQEKPDIPAASSESQSGGSNETAEKKEEGEVDDSQETESKQGESESTEQLDSGDTSNNAGASAEPEVKTVDSLDESLRELISNHGGENVYVELPKVNLDTVVAKNPEIHEYIDSNWNIRDEDPFRTPDSLFAQFKRSAQKEVNYLVKEFECKKAADSYARASVSRTGVLDCSSYILISTMMTFSERLLHLLMVKIMDLYLFLTGQVQWQNVLEDTCKQLFNLIWFCKKVNIPFEVYAFTNEWIKHNISPNGGWEPLIPHYEAEDGQLAVEENSV